MALKDSIKTFSAILDVEMRLVGGEVCIEKKGVWRNILGLEIPVNLKYMASFEGMQDGVVFQVIGHLGILVSYFSKTDSASVYLLNLSKLAGEDVGVGIRKLVKPRGSLRENIESLRAMVVGSYYYRDGSWKKLTLPT